MDNSHCNFIQRPLRVSEDLYQRSIADLYAGEIVLVLRLSTQQPIAKS